MRKQIILCLVFMICLTFTACSSDSKDSSTEESNEISLLEPENSTQSSNFSNTQNSKPNNETTNESSNSSAPSSQSNSEQSLSTPETNNTVNAPTISSSVFCQDVSGASVSITITGTGRYNLSSGLAQDLFSGIDLSSLSPTAQAYSIDMQSADPAVVFTSADFSHELRVDKNANVAVYVTGGNTYFYTMPAGFYDAVSARALEHMQYDDTSNANVTTGVPEGENPTTDEDVPINVELG